MALAAHLDVTSKQESQVLVLLNHIFHVVESKTGGLGSCLVAEAIQEVLVCVV